jgi:hypothetical protein
VALFSQRKGHKPASNALQSDVVDKDLRNSLWSALHDAYFSHWNDIDHYGGGFLSRQGQEIRVLLETIWREYFKYPSDTVPDWSDIADRIRRHHFECKWYEVYDLLEFVIKHAPERSRGGFRQLCNARMQQENSAYRMVDLEVVEITSTAEIDEIESAIASPLEGVREHLSTALALLSERKRPDYRNCAKEAILAVEGACRLFGGGNTLGDALKVLKKKVEIHRALERSLSALYGYASDEGGIRHALLKKSTISFADAKFMLVTCSAFTNYLIGKASEANIPLSK